MTARPRCYGKPGEPGLVRCDNPDHGFIDAIGKRCPAHAGTDKGDRCAMPCPGCPDCAPKDGDK